MINQFLIVLILYLLMNQTIQYLNDSTNKNDDNVDSEQQTDSEEVEEKKNDKTKKSKEPTIPLDLFGKPHDYKEKEYIVWVFNQPSPWNQIIYLYNQEYPFKFFIKIKIPTLNDYTAWKEVIPNLDFNAKTGELIIPAKNEASALALTNLIISNFKGNLKLETILEKSLIQVSVAKANQFELVRTKLREQILEVIQGKTKPDNVNSTNSNNDYEEDLAKSNIKASNMENLEEFRNNEPAAATDMESYSYI